MKKLLIILLVFVVACRSSKEITEQQLQSVVITSTPDVRIFGDWEELAVYLDSARTALKVELARKMDSVTYMINVRDGEIGALEGKVALQKIIIDSLEDRNVLLQNIVNDNLPAGSKTGDQR